MASRGNGLLLVCAALAVGACGADPVPVEDLVAEAKQIAAEYGRPGEGVEGAGRVAGEFTRDLEESFGAEIYVPEPVPAAILGRLADLTEVPSAPVRREALRAIRCLWPDAGDLATRLLPRLADEHAEVRLEAALALAEMGRELPRAVPVLVSALLAGRNPAEPLIRQSPPGTSFLGEVLDLPEANDAPSAMWGLHFAGREAVPALLQMIESPRIRPAVRRLAVRTVARIEGLDPAECVESLAVAARDDYLPLAREAVRGLAVLGVGSNEVAVLLEQEYETAGDVMRREIVVAVATVEAGLEEGLLWLADALEDEDADVRAGAADRLHAWGAGAAAVLPSLIDRLYDPDGSVVTSALWRIRGIGPAAADALPHLEEIALGDRDPALILLAIEAVLHVRGEADEFVPLVALLLRSRDPRLRSRAVELMVRLGPASAGAVEELRNSLWDESRWVRRKAVAALGNAGAAAKPALHRIEDLSLRGDEEIRHEALLALWRIDPGQAERVLDAVRDLLRREDDILALRNAQIVVAGMGAAARPLEFRLRELVENGGAWARFRGATMLAFVRPDTNEALEPLVFDLREGGEPTIRQLAAVGLENLGARAEGAIPALERAVREDPARMVRRAAEQAIRLIREAKLTRAGGRGSRGS